MTPAYKPNIIQRATNRVRAWWSPAATTESFEIDEAMLETPLGNQLARLMGSLVPSPIQDKYEQWRQYGINGNVAGLFDLYTELRELFVSEVLLDEANKRRTRGAVAKGFDYQVTPIYQSDSDKIDAKWAQEILRPLADLINGSNNLVGYDYNKREDQPITLADVSESLGRYANLPTQGVWTGSSITEIHPMPPFAWIKHSNGQGEWDDPEKAYSQHDTLNWQVVPDGWFSSKKIVWIKHNAEPWDRYGLPDAMRCRTHVAGVIDLFEGLADARLNATPLKTLESDKSLNVQELKRLKDSLPAAMRKRGQKVNVWDFWKILIGAKMHIANGGTEFLSINNFGDQKSFDTRIALSMGVSLATLIGTETVNRATLEFLMRMEASMQRLWMQGLISCYIMPWFRRQLDDAGIRKERLKCEILVTESETPEELLAKATCALEMQAQGLLADEDATTQGCKYLGIDPKQALDKLQKQKDANKLLQPGLQPQIGAKPQLGQIAARIQQINKTNQQSDNSKLDSQLQN